ncbi:MAG: YcxB family protein [Coriobacteriia bacterium]|nr:YcxB family protein [Coriobacteriia bacterium]
MSGPGSPDTAVERARAGEPLTVSVTVDQAGYRGVLLAVTASKLRFVLPIMAFFGFGALATGFNAHSLFLLSGVGGVIAFVWFYVNWASGSPAHRDVYVPVTYVFDDEAIHYTGQGGEGLIPWARIRRWRVRSRHYLLYTDVTSFILVPVAALSDDDVPRFENLLTRHAKGGSTRSNRP